MLCPVLGIFDIEYWMCFVHSEYSQKCLFANNVKKKTTVIFFHFYFIITVNGK